MSGDQEDGLRRPIGDDHSVTPPPDLAAGVPQPSLEVFRALVHELRTHQSELEAQNEELRLAQEEICAARDKYSDLYDFAPIGYFTLSEKDVILETNLKGAELLRTPRADVVGRAFSGFVAPNSTDAYYLHLKGVTASEATQCCELQLAAAATSDAVFAQVTTSRVLSADGILCGFRSAAIDITERRRVEQEREELIAELGVKNAELERFAYTISHDLKSPLITITGYLGALEEDLAAGDGEAVRDCLRHLCESAARMGRLLDDLLELSRIGRVIGSRERVELAELVEAALDALHGPISDAGIRAEIVGDLPVVYGDRTRLGEALQNLIENAVKYMGDREAPRIVIGSRREGEQTVCWVRDNGRGIEPQFHQQIFELFNKLDRKSEGTGIGLALVRRIVQVHGGRVWVESDGPGMGATFCFTVPDIAE